MYIIYQQRLCVILSIIFFLSSGTNFVNAQSDTVYYFDFEALDVEVKNNQVISSIKNNHGLFQDAVPRYPNLTVAFGNRHSYRNAEFGNYPVGRQFLYHSPSWFTPDEKGISFNHVELTLDSALEVDSYYRISFLIANMKSHKWKPAHYGVKFSQDKILKEGQGALMSEPDVYFDFTNDDELVEIQAVMFFEKPISYIYFGMFEEDSMRVPKKYTPGTDKISYTDTAAYYQVVKTTRVVIDNLLIERLDKTKDTFRDIYFKHDDDKVSMQKDVDQIEIIAQKMKATPESYLLIQGYADPSGAFLYNLDLSARRAAHVKEILIAQGIAEERIVTIGKGIFPMEAKNIDPEYARKVSFLLLQ